MTIMSNAVSSFVILICVICLIDIKQCDADQQQKFCGSQLNDVLELVCNGQFHSMHKKSVFSDEDYSYSIDQEVEPNVEPDVKPDVEPKKQLPFISKLFGDAIHPRFRRTIRRGVHYECCINTCTFKELTDYCMHDHF